VSGVRRITVEEFQEIIADQVVTRSRRLVAQALLLQAQVPKNT